MEKRRLKGYGLGTAKRKKIFNLQNVQNNFLKTGSLFRDAINIKKYLPFGNPYYLALS